MVHAKTTTVLKREASKAKEVQLQHALAAYQEALLNNEVLSVREAARASMSQEPHSRSASMDEDLSLSPMLRSPGLLMLRVR
jgi:hypothetical protein